MATRTARANTLEDTLDEIQTRFRNAGQELQKMQKRAEKNRRDFQKRTEKRIQQAQKDFRKLSVVKAATSAGLDAGSSSPCFTICCRLSFRAALAMLMVYRPAVWMVASSSTRSSTLPTSISQSEKSAIVCSTKSMVSGEQHWFSST